MRLSRIKRKLRPVKLTGIPEKDYLLLGRPLRKAKARLLKRYRIPLIQVTPVVKRYASHFSAEPKKLIVDMVRDLDVNFQNLELPLKYIKDFYLQRTADEIIRSRKIFAAADEHRLIVGCNDYAIVVGAVLKSRNIPFKVARMKNHTMIRAELEGKEYFIDLASLDEAMLREINVKIKQHLESLKKKGMYAEGDSFEEIGMLSLKDFSKYGPR
jgi:hypothetical protein